MSGVITKESTIFAFSGWALSKRFEPFTNALKEFLGTD